MKPTIPLTERESELVASIEFDATALVGHHSRYQQNAADVLELVRSLVARNAIPANRLRYFVQPECFPGGRGRSHKDTFERNGTTGDEIVRHPHFLKFLRYFLYGCSLPDHVVQTFKAQVEACGPISSGDIEPLRKAARQWTRSNDLNRYEASEEFFKLALDLGLRPAYADGIRRAVRGTH